MQIELTDNYLKRRLAAAVPGAYYDLDSRKWYFDPEIYPASVRIAIKLFPEVAARIPAELMPKTTAAFRPNEVATEWAGDDTAEQLLPNTPESITRMLRRYQAVDIAFSVARLRADNGVYIGWDRGLGKSLAAIVIAYELEAKHVLIITPNNSKLATWVPQINEWDHLLKYKNNIYNFMGSKGQREYQLREWQKNGGVLLMHYEGLRLLEKPETIKADLTIIDESHRLSKGNAGRGAPKFYKALKKIKSKFRVCMSGSIILNSPEDLFGPLHWLFPSRYRARHRDWNDRYLLYADGPFGKELIGVRPEALDAMREELSAFMLVRTKDDELPDLPERIEENVYVELSPEQRRVYDELAETFIAQLNDDDTITTGSVLAQLIKLRQVACGLDLIDDAITDSSKLDTALELISSILPGKVVVFTWHKATAYALEKRITESKLCDCAVITGDTPMIVRADIVEKFQKSPIPDVIIATIKTLGESVTLHASSDVIFLESSWVPADMEQAADRVRRIGQTQRVNVYNIIAKDTVDETKILPALESKDMLRRLILGK